jgi:chromosome partitioning protein
VAEPNSSPSPSEPFSATRADPAAGAANATGRARIIAIANQKGGVGKSTTAVSLGAALAELGYQVLVMDLDPQGNASTGMGIRHETRDVTVYDVLASEAGIEQAIVKTQVENLHAIPSTIDLAGAEIELVSQFSRELRLRRALDPIREGSYDFILIDCPPSLGLLTVNALAAAEELIVPIQCEYYALEGLGQLLRNVKLVQQNVNPGLRLTGIVLTMFDPRTKLAEQVVEEVRRYFGDRVYDSVIPRTVRLSEAPGFGQPITVYDPRSRGAERYRGLAREVAERERTGDPMPAFDDMPVMVPTPAADEGSEPSVTTPTELEAPPTEPKADPQPERVYEFDPSSPNGGPPANLPQADEPSMPAEPEPEPVVEPDLPTFTGSAVPSGEVDVNPRGPVEMDGAAEAAGPDLAPHVDIPDTAVIADLETPSVVAPFDQDAPEPRRRKWSLFRKGEDR